LAIFSRAHFSEQDEASVLRQLHHAIEHRKLFFGSHEHLCIDGDSVKTIPSKQPSISAASRARYAQRGLIVPPVHRIPSSLKFDSVRAVSRHSLPVQPAQKRFDGILTIGFKNSMFEAPIAQGGEQGKKTSHHGPKPSAGLWSSG
jgi:hypothetical protein